ncbi:MAG: hypothetical protein Q7T82_00595 [Armatimonadota bacterium]|nr:hypothetical protein [Armatimonadota bacterium]
MGRTRGEPTADGALKLKIAAKKIVIVEVVAGCEIGRPGAFCCTRPAIGDHISSSAYSAYVVSDARLCPETDECMTAQLAPRHRSPP